MSKQWKILSKISEEEFSKFPDINKIILQLLYNRKVNTQEKIDEFFNADYIGDIYDPYILLDMKVAVGRIYQALKNKERVLVYGDYDADGVTSSVLLVDILDFVGIKAEVYIPARETEGYGLNLDAVKEIINNKYNLVITCDCGISNFEEVEEFNKNNVDVIITDHHKEPEKLPNAYAIINAGLKREKYPCKNLAGVGIAYKLASGILKSDLCHLSDDEIHRKAKWLLDLVAIGSITDMVPLVSENRTLVKYGLLVLPQTKRLGLQQLYEISGTNVEKINSYTIGFQIGPRLNAAGRMDHANTAFELLKTNNLESAIEISRDLNVSNTKRQDVTAKIVSEAKSQIDCVDENTKYIWASDKNWSLGVIGLVAGKLSQEYYRPAFVLGYDGQDWVCSSRGIDEIDLMEIITNVSDKLIRFGGHKAAAGFSLKEENIEYVKNSIKEQLEKKLKGLELSPSFYIDTEISFQDIDWQLWDYLEKFEPYGMENNRPKFLAKNCTIKEIQYLGKDKTHLKITLEQNKNIKKAIGFSMVNKFSKLETGDNIDIVFEIDINEWNGTRSLELYIVDLKINK